MNILSTSSSYNGTSDKWEDLDLTDSRYIKVFAFPYCPCDFMVGRTNFDILPAPFAFNADNSMYRVIVATYHDRDSAAAARDAFKAKYPNRNDFQGAWLLYRIN